MSRYLNGNLIAGISQNKICNAHFLLEPIWSDHLINDISLLRADTFSWQSGDVYVTAYNHLVQDIQGITSETETIGSYTVTFYRATDGHKIALADQETTIANIYSETGIAWYYILDTTNTQFKLPRTKYGFEGLRGNVGDNIDESLPNIKGHNNTISSALNKTNFSGALYSSNLGTDLPQSTQVSAGGHYKLNFDASRSSSTYQDNAPVQERATQMYLYFYVGDYTQTAIEQTAGLNSELFNGKVDLPVGRTQNSVSLLIESYVNGTSWYRVYSDGWCEQGGSANSSGALVSLLKPYTNTYYTINLGGGQSNGWGVAAHSFTYYNKTTSGFNIRMEENSTLSGGMNCTWQTYGYIN